MFYERSYNINKLNVFNSQEVSVQASQLRFTKDFYSLYIQINLYKKLGFLSKISQNLKRIIKDHFEVFSRNEL